MQNFVQGLSRLSFKQAVRRLTAGCLILISGLILFQASDAQADSAKAFSLGRRPLKISVLTGPRGDFCYSDHIDAIEKLAKAERDRINKTGGIAGRPVDIQILDDEGEGRRTVTNVSGALADPDTIALIGLQSTDRAQAVFKQLGPRLAESGVPWISSIGLTNLFAGYPNVFTIQGSQEEENIPVITEFLKERNLTRPAFIGMKGGPSEGLLKAYGEKRGFPGFADTQLMHVSGADAQAKAAGKIDPADITKEVEQLKWKNPDIIFLNVGTLRTAPFL